MTLLFLGASVLSIAIYAHTVISDLSIAIIDEDRSTVSRTIHRFIDATRELRVVEKQLPLKEAEERLVTGDLAAVLVIPEDFSRLLKRGKEARLLLAVDGSNLLSGKTAQRTIEKVVKTVAAGIRLTTVRKMGEPRRTALARVLPVTISDNPLFNPAGNYAVYLVPALFFFFLHIWFLIVAASLPVARRTTEHPMFHLGERVALLCAAYLFSLVFIYGVMPSFGVFFESSVFIVMGMLFVFLVLDLFLVATVKALFPFNALLSLQVVILLGMLSLMFSGVTWPTDMFPEPIAKFSYLIPFTPFAKGMRIFLHYPVTIRDLGPIWFVFFYEALIYAILWGVARGVSQVVHRRKAA